LHILIISNGYPTFYNSLNGIFYRDQAEALAAFSHTVGFVAVIPESLKHIIQKKSLAHLGFENFFQKNVDTWLYKYINLPKSPRYSIHKSLSKGKHLVDEYVKKRGKPDVVHMHCFEAVELADYIKKTYNVPFVVTEHSSRFLNDSLSPLVERYAHKAFTESSANVAVSNFFAKRMMEKYRVPFQYIPNVVDTDFFNREKEKGSPFTFINVAVLDNNKNQATLIKAFSKVSEKIKDVCLLIVGDGPQRDYLIRLIAKLEVEDKVSIAGFVSREEVKRYLQEADAFVLSSHYETFGVVLIEAMSCGLPLISTKCIGPLSIIADPALGMLCENTVESMMESMINLFQNFSTYDRGFIRQYAIDNFSNFAIAKKLTSLYETLLSK
jgi:glycosyltransferase involved in cell wall biosynthesis